MTNILVHGLGQDEKSWNQVKNQLNNNGINVETPNLFSVVKNNQVNYENMYKTFADYCNSFNQKINLVGLSLGGVLAIDYITEFPERINSIILIGTPYEIPKIIFTIQNIIYKFMPKRIFEKMGCPKKDIIRLLDSMKNLSIPNKAPSIKSNTLIICGEKEKDNINMKSAKKLNEVIQNSKFKVIENAGHEINIDNPKELANIIYDFWKDNENDIK
ncbi:MAG: alpha/beta hydrolase [Clostridia bacterium]|nr:alpha/beta hydrolase [Clostridia bacterium]